MTDLLHRAGEALYGPRWQRELARALGVTDRTVRRWAAGTHPVPRDAQKQIIGLLRQRRRRLDRIIAGSAEPDPAGPDQAQPNPADPGQAPPSP